MSLTAYPRRRPCRTSLSVTQVLTGGKVLIGGFVLTGSGTQQMLVRGLGPTLADFGVTGVSD